MKHIFEIGDIVRGITSKYGITNWDAVCEVMNLEGETSFINGDVMELGEEPNGDEQTCVGFTIRVLGTLDSWSLANFKDVCFDGVEEEDFRLATEEEIIKIVNRKVDINDLPFED